MSVPAVLTIIIKIMPIHSFSPVQFRVADHQNDHYCLLALDELSKVIGFSFSRQALGQWGFGCLNKFSPSEKH